MDAVPPLQTSARLRAAAVIAATTVLVGALAACGDASGGAQGASERPGTLSAVAEPPVAGIDHDPDDPATWVVSGEGVGDIRVGARFDETLEALPGQWRRVADCGAEWTGDGGVTVTFVRDGSEIAAVEVAGSIGAPSEAPRTREGLGIGSMRDEVTAVYPAFSERSSGDGEVVHPEADPGVAFELGAGDRVVGMLVAPEAAPACEASAGE